MRRQVRVVRRRRFLSKNWYLVLGDALIQPLGFKSIRRSKGRQGLRVWLDLKGLIAAALFGWAVLPNAVLVPEPYGRWGNQCFQLVYGLVLAKRVKARALILPQNTLSQGIYLTISHGQNVSLTSMEGSFLRRHFFAFLQPNCVLTLNPFHLHDGQDLVTRVSRGELRDAFEALIASDVPNLPKCQSPNESDLVIHLRAGDVFGESPPPDYAQPPLSFYRMVLEDRDWTSMTLVREDSSHPFELEIISLFERSGVPVCIQSGTIEEDLAFLVSATTLVASVGTFIPAVSGFSRTLKTVYVFGPESRWKEGIGIRRVIDESGELTRICFSNNWENSAAQIRTLTSWPKESLSFSDE